MHGTSEIHVYANTLKVLVFKELEEERSSYCCHSTKRAVVKS